MDILKVERHTEGGCVYGIRFFSRSSVRPAPARASASRRMVFTASPRTKRSKRVCCRCRGKTCLQITKTAYRAKNSVDGTVFSCASRSRTYDGGVKVPCLTAWRWRIVAYYFNRTFLLCQVERPCSFNLDMKSPNLPLTNPPPQPIIKENERGMFYGSMVLRGRQL